MYLVHHIILPLPKSKYTKKKPHTSTVGYVKQSTTSNSLMGMMGFIDGFQAMLWQTDFQHFHLKSVCKRITLLQFDQKNSARSALQFGLDIKTTAAAVSHLFLKQPLTPVFF